MVAFILEVQKCFQEHGSNLNWKLHTWLPNAGKEKFCYHLCKDPDSLFERIQQCNKCKIAEDRISNFENVNSGNYKKLQQDVTKLEYEVQSFLDSQIRDGC